MDHVIDNEYFIPFQLCREILSKAKIPHEDKVRLFALTLDGLGVDECKECLMILELKEYLSVFNGKRPTVLVTNINKTILEIFLKKDWIVGYDLDKKDNSMYRISSKRVFKKQTLPTELL